MTVEFEEPTFAVKVVRGKDGVDRTQLPLTFVPEVPKPESSLKKDALSTKPPLFVTFADRSQPRELDDD